MKVWRSFMIPWTRINRNKFGFRYNSSFLGGDSPQTLVSNWLECTRHNLQSCHRLKIKSSDHYYVKILETIVQCYIPTKNIVQTTHDLVQLMFSSKKLTKKNWAPWKPPARLYLLPATEHRNLLLFLIAL